MYQKPLIAGWGDMDYNAHMRNTAYLDKSADVRMMYFADNGFPMAEFARLQLGPVVMKDVVEYFREVKLLEEIDVRLEMAGMSDDCSRMTLRNEFYRKGVLAARVTSTVGWFDLKIRKLVCPPDNLALPLRALSRTEDFIVLPTSQSA
ncbi:MAG: thioesterase family protein [Pseudomonadota bacterium]